MPSSQGSSSSKGTLHGLEGHVATLLRRRASRNVNVLEDAERQGLGARTADTLAKAAGSWTFIIAFFCVLAIWMAVNVVGALRHWDPYPFILLNLVLSCVAAIQAPVILMSQNRAEARDRIRAEADYQVNLKAEVLLEHLTSETDRMKTILEQIERRLGERPSSLAEGPGD
jgi:uncharacterized membrane protein